MTGELSDTDLTRLARTGVQALSSEEALELFDAGLASERALLIPIRLDTAKLRAMARAGMAPALLRGLARTPSRRATAGAGRSLARRLAAVPEAEYEGVMLELVRAEVAIVLGSASPEAVPAQRAFLELGLDSLTAVELRNRLDSITGLRLPATLVFDHPSPAELASYLAAQLVLAGEGRAGQSDAVRDVDPGGAPLSGAPLPGGEPAQTMGSLLRQACDLDQVEDFIGLLTSACRFRPTFERALDPDRAPRPVKLAEGDSGPALICLPPVLPMAGALQYVRLAKAFRGIRDVSALPLPGFTAGEELPATMQVAVETQAGIVERYANGAPFVLAGYSSGGGLACAVASQLESIGIHPLALVLIDTYPPESDTILKIVPDLMQKIIAQEDTYMPLSDVELIAMGAYIRLFAEWEPNDIACPTLLIRAAEPVPGWSADVEWRSHWNFSHDVIDTPGSHFTILEKDADSTAAAVQTWLSSTVDQHNPSVV